MKEIEIPEGYKARIEGNKVILEPTESEDERIRKALIDLIDVVDETYLEYYLPIPEPRNKMIAYLEKQKEQAPIEDAIKNITKNKESATNFLKSAGIMDDNGELAEMYRSEQKPAGLSEEDTYRFQQILNVLDRNEYPVLVNWVKAFQERFNLPPKQEWSEENEKMHRTLIHDLGVICEKVYPYNVNLKKELNWLKSIHLQPKQEWSEEDEKMLHRIICDLREFRNREADKELISDYEEEITWLKFLRPKSHWTPSEEQMEALNEIINTLAVSKHPHESDYLFNMLKGLRKNLKKL